MGLRDDSVLWYEKHEVRKDNDIIYYGIREGKLLWAVSVIQELTSWMSGTYFINGFTFYCESVWIKYFIIIKIYNPKNHTWYT